jgi:Holliday junction resolvase RusA-like endonuclease
MAESITFTIPLLPPSVNALYQIIYGQRRVILKPEVVAWKTKAKEYVPVWHPSGLVRVDVVYYYNWFTKDGELRNVDTQNFQKPLIDMIANKQGWNDKVAKFGSYDSVDAPNEDDHQVEIKLSDVEIPNRQDS